MNNVSSVSAVIIARDAEKTLVRAIAGVSWCREVIVVDNGSGDKTAAIAAEKGARVVTVSGSDFSVLRNTGQKAALSEWIFYLDADEVVSPELALEIRKQIGSAGSEIGAFSVPRQNYYYGVRWPAEERLERLFRRSSLKSWHGKVHESPEFSGRLLPLQNFLFHYTHNDLESMTAKTNEWSAIEAGLLDRSGHPGIVPWRIGRVFVTGWARSFFRGGSWKMGRLGIIESLFQGFSMAVTYLKLWEKQNQFKVKN